jgi:hypothetical protein
MQSPRLLVVILLMIVGMRGALSSREAGIEFRMIRFDDLDVILPGFPGVISASRVMR